MNKSLSSKYLCDPTANTSSLGVFRDITKLYAFVMLVVITLVTADLMTNYTFSPSINGLNEFVLVVLKVPVSISAVYISVIGLIALNHRSEQTRVQIAETRGQNIFSNHFKHREYFIEYAKELYPERFNTKTGRLIIIYRHLFPKSLGGDLTLNNNIIHDFIECCGSLQKIVQQKSFSVSDLAINDLDTLLKLCHSIGYDCPECQTLDMDKLSYDEKPRRLASCMYQDLAIIYDFLSFSENELKIVESSFLSLSNRIKSLGLK